MKISFRKKKLAKTFNQERLLVKEYGKENGRVIMRRMDVLKAALNLEQVPRIKPERLHELKGDRKGEFAVDLKHPFRLILIPDCEDIPRNKDGGIDLQSITSIIIKGVEDYH